MQQTRDTHNITGDIMSLYIGTFDCNNKLRVVTDFADKDSLYYYVNSLDCHKATRAMNIDQMCAALYDGGPGKAVGMRSHRRITAKEAEKFRREEKAAWERKHGGWR